MSDRQVTLQDLFAESVARYPNDTALEVGGVAYSYLQLSTIIDRLASQLTRVVGRVPSRIGLFASRTLQAYVGYLAVLRLGAAVVPLNPSWPPRRNQLVAHACGLELTLSDRELPAELTVPLERGRVYRLTDGVLVAATSSADPPAPSKDRHLAYILFTSGSTGRPKGVPVAHANVVPFVEYNRRRYGIGPGSRLSQTFDLTFDLSVFDLFVSWAGGGAVVVPDKLDLLSPAQYVNRRAITHWFSVPSVISYAAELDELEPGSMPGLEVSLFCGEQLTRTQSALWSAAAPNSAIENLYGPTELTVACSAYRLRDAAAAPPTSNGTIPLGEVYPHLDAILVDSGRVDPVHGELCVRGPQRFSGYLCEDDNRDRFLQVEQAKAILVDDLASGIPDTAWYRTGDLVRREHGLLVHVGRIDHQVKVRGHRVEPGEVAGVIRDHPRVHDCIVLAHDAPGLGTQLVAAYTGEPVPDGELAGFVRQSLPSYMTPSCFLHLDTFPVNENGKIDRFAVLAMMKHG